MNQLIHCPSEEWAQQSVLLRSLRGSSPVQYQHSTLGNLLFGTPILVVSVVRAITMENVADITFTFHY